MVSPDPPPNAAPPHDLAVRIRQWRLRSAGSFGLASGASAEFRGALGKALHEQDQFGAWFDPDLVAGGEPGALRGGSGAPRPFVCRGPTPPELPPDGGTTVAELVLFGAAARQAGTWDEAVRRAAGDGFGHPRAAFEVIGTRDWFEGTVHEWIHQRRSQLTVCAGPVAVRVSLQTPTYLKRAGARVDPSTATLTAAALRRMENLAQLYGAAVDGSGDRRALLDEAAHTDRHPDYRSWFDCQPVRRFSHRQRQPIRIAGVVGWFQGPVSDRVLDVLLAAELLHVGKSTTLGMGRVRVGAASAATPPR